jgi:hypothetical protein
VRHNRSLLHFAKQHNRINTCDPITAHGELFFLTEDIKVDISNGVFVRLQREHDVRH